MEPIAINFQRAGKPFEAKITDKSCIVRDLTADPRFNLPYKFEIQQIIITTGDNASVQVTFKTGLETSTGEMVNVNNGSWRFSHDHPDMLYFVSNFGLKFMGSCINGFVKHYMKNNPMYSEMETDFLGVLDDLGAYIIENND